MSSKYIFSVKYGFTLSMANQETVDNNEEKMHKRNSSINPGIEMAIGVIISIKFIYFPHFFVILSIIISQSTVKYGCNEHTWLGTNKICSFKSLFVVIQNFYVLKWYFGIFTFFFFVVINNSLQLWQYKWVSLYVLNVWWIWHVT